MFKDNHIINKLQPLFIFSFKKILIQTILEPRTDCHVKKNSYISGSLFTEYTYEI